MADIRINAIATTATDFASDDYIAIDGTANGTRKVNAKTANLTFGDVRFGTSGPSAKSSIAARAARQGLVFDGTAGVTISSAIPALGTGDFTLTAWVKHNNLPAAGENSIFGSTYGATRGLSIRRATTGDLVIDRAGIVNMGVATLTNQTAGVIQMLTVVRSSGVLTVYQNGVALTTTQGTPTANIDGVTDIIGAISGGTSLVMNGTIAPLAYNRALSAAEVVSLYEAGVPSGADYNNASNTSLLTGANSDFSSAGNWSVQGATTISGGKLNLSNGDAAYNGLAPLTVGKRYRLTITVDSLTAGLVQYYNGSTYVAFASAPGTYTVDFTCAATFAPGLHLRSSGGNAVLDTALYYPLGLLLAPDAAQAGGGLTWYDTSGNAANITLPASGVTWNVPTSGKMATSLSISSAVSATPGTNGVLTLNTTGTNPSTGSGGGLLLAQQASTGSLVNYGSIVGVRKNSAANDFVDLAIFTGGPTDAVALTERLRISAQNGNALLGTTTDSANGKLQLATHTTSAGGIGFGTATSLYTQAAGNLALDHIGGTNPVLNFRENAVAKAYVGTSGSILYVGTNTANSVVLQTNATTALTLDSSQRCILSGALRLNNTFQPGAPTATGYVTIQDSAGNTYKVLVGT